MGRAVTLLAQLLAMATAAQGSVNDGVCEADTVPTSRSAGAFGPGDPVRIVHIREQRFINGTEFPLVLGPNPAQCPDGCTFEQIRDWVAHSHNIIDNLLLRHGAVLFRGFPVDSAEVQNTFVEAFGFDNFPYVGGAAPRRQLAPRVFTTNESPASEKIPFHHEMAQVPKFPTKVFFHCEIPPETGGETPILASWEIRDALEKKYPDFVAKLEQGVRYIRVLPEEDDPTSAIGRGWKSTYATSSREEVEDRLRQLNYTGEWLPHGDLKTLSPVLPAIRYDSGPGRSGRRTFFNSVVAVYTGWNDVRNKGELAIQFADGTHLDREIIEDAALLMEGLEVAFKWEKGDVILIDNHTVMHSRKPFTGKRVITASLGTHSYR